MFQAKHYSRVSLAIIFVLIATFVGMAASQNFTGVLSETMCGAKHMLPGKTDADCTLQCVKANSKYALVVDKKAYTLAGSLEEAPSLAGKRVQITGEKNGDTITVKSIGAANK
jgi:hypothetical protein